MVGLMKMWKKMQGYKRQAGAVIALVPIAASIVGVNIPQQYVDTAIMLGTLIWGIGWADAGAREVAGRIGKKEAK